MKAALRLQTVKDAWGAGQGTGPGDLDEALAYNRKLWTVLVSAATAPENPLPVALKQNLANLGIFVFGQTLRLMAEPAAEGLGVLININRDLAAGLRAQQAAA